MPSSVTGPAYDPGPVAVASPSATSTYPTTGAWCSTGGLQTTLGSAFEQSGHGLHTGRAVTVRVCPATAEHGIVFRRTLPDGRMVDVPADWRFRVRQPLCTALRSDGDICVRTVEHLMAALSAMQIDNALVCLDAEELPIFDGSAVPWCEGIRAAGWCVLDAPRQFIDVLRSVEVRTGHRSLRIEPYPKLHISAYLALRHFGPMTWDGTIDPVMFCADVAPARSFGRFSRAMLGRIYGVATQKPFLQGVGPTSAALLIRDRVIGGMRLPGEPVRHRVLDLIGDLSLAGHPLRGRIIARHTGHELNHALVAALMSQPDTWRLTGRDASELSDTAR